MNNKKEIGNSIIFNVRNRVFGTVDVHILKSTSHHSFFLARSSIKDNVYESIDDHVSRVIWNFKSE